MAEGGSALSGEASRARWKAKEKKQKSPQTGPVVKIPRSEEAQKRIILTLQNAEFGQVFVKIEKKVNKFDKNLILDEFGSPLNMS